MCSPEALAFGKAVGNLAAGMQQGADIAYQNRLNLYKHHQTVQASKESFVSSMGAKGAELMQMSEAAGQELSQLRSQAREAAASVSIGALESETTGPSVFAAIDEVFAKEAEAAGAVDRERQHAIHSYYMEGGIGAERASRQAEASWTPPQPEPSGLLMILNFMGDVFKGINEGNNLGLGDTAIAPASPSGMSPAPGYSQNPYQPLSRSFLPTPVSSSQVGGLSIPFTNRDSFSSRSASVSYPGIPRNLWPQSQHAGISHWQQQSNLKRFGLWQNKLNLAEYR